LRTSRAVVYPSLSVRPGLRILSTMAPSLSNRFPWRPAVFVPLAVTLFALAIYFYNKFRVELGLTLLGFAFALPMMWVMLAARDAERAESPIKQFVPRLMAVLVLGSAFLGFVMRDQYPRVSLIEAAFIIFYIAAGVLTLRTFNARGKHPTLTALSGGSQSPRQRREARRGK
jgi:hypothetical protein